MFAARDCASSTSVLTFAVASPSRARGATIARRASSEPRRDLRKQRAGPTTPAPTYTTSLVDKNLRSIFARKMADELDGPSSSVSPASIDGAYDGVRDMCLRLVRESSSAEEVRARGLRILRACVGPSWVPKAFGAFLRLFPRWFAARHAASVTPLILPWLVGDAEVNDVPDDVVLDATPGDVPSSALAAALGLPKERAGYKQGVLLKRCRVLEETGCAAVCANVCKVPTQKFFTEEVGLPVTLTPNYETFECQFSYGATPPALSEDAAFSTPCFRQCPVSETLREDACERTLSGDGRIGQN